MTARVGAVAAVTPEAQRNLDMGALELRIRGVGYAKIADQLGISDQTAINWCQRAMARESNEKLGAARKIAQQRLDRLLDAIWPKALAGSQSATRTALAIIDRHCRLLGLDAPIKVQDVTEPVESQVDRDIRELLEEFETKRAATEHELAQ